MKTLILKSNHGNHSGFNRKWTILEECDSEDINIVFSKVADYVADKYSLTEEQIEEIYSASGFEYDLCYYVPVTEDEYNKGIFDGGHYGYASSDIVRYFEGDN